MPHFLAQHPNLSTCIYTCTSEVSVSPLHLKLHDCKHSYLQKVLFLSQLLWKYHWCTERATMDQEWSLVGTRQNWNPIRSFIIYNSIACCVQDYNKERNLSSWVSFRQCHNKKICFEVVHEGVIKPLLEVKNKCVSFSTYLHLSKFLAHLSWRLGVSYCDHSLSVVCPSTPWNDFFSETPGAIFFKFHMETSVNGKLKICTNGHVR